MGGFGIVGQVINVPVDVNYIVTTLQGNWTTIIALTSIQIEI
jgi:ABC-type long-subunit fatty acid transport system fused permease/ATPase subunit